MITPAFWKHKKVLLTGHTGFKGSWLSLWLQRMQADVVGYALAPTTPLHLFGIADVAVGMKSIIGDIRDITRLEELVVGLQPDVIIHMAAQSLVRRGYQHPVETYMTNLMGTVHVLDAVRRSNPTHPLAVLVVTSDKCYQNHHTGQAYDETDPLGGGDPYSTSKACAELVTSAYRATYLNHGIGLASVRAGNVIGGGDWAEDRLIPDLIHAHLTKTPLKLRYPEAIRPWQHVLDALSGYLCLAEALYHEPSAYAEAWNFGSDTPQSVRFILDYIKTLGFSPLIQEQPLDAAQPEATCLVLNSDKAKTRLGWQPQWDLETALQKTFHWYDAYAHHAPMRDVCFEQLDQYQF